VAGARKRLSVVAEKESQVLRLRFRHPDPKVATNFLGAVTDAFLQRQAALAGYAAAPTFFKNQADNYKNNYEIAASRLNAFSEAHSTFAIEKEIQLAIGRRDEAVASLAKTKGILADKEAQAATLQNTLTQLRRRISLPNEIIGPKHQAPPDTDLLSNNKIPANESPLLLVRVFQDTAQQLVNLNAQIIGVRALEGSQKETLVAIEKKLIQLSSLQAQFERLKSEMDQAANILEAYVKRTAEAQMNVDWDATEKLSSVKVMQAATAPFAPVFPQFWLFVLVGSAIGLLGGASVSLFREFRRSGDRSDDHPAPSFEQDQKAFRSTPRRVAAVM